MNHKQSKTRDLPPLNEAKVEAFRRCYSRLNVVLGAANSIAGHYLAQSVEMLRKDKKLCRFEVKHIANECLRLFDAYERAHLTDYSGLKAFYITYLDMMDDKCLPHTERMYWAIKNRLDRDRVQRSDLVAMVELTLTLIDYSVVIYDSLIADVHRKTGYDFNRVLHPARLGPLLKQWENLERKVCRTPKGVKIDLNQDPVCLTGLRCIENVLTNADIHDRAAQEALKLCPDIAAQYGIDPDSPGSITTPK